MRRWFYFKKTFFIGCFLLFPGLFWGQLSDLARIEYTNLPSLSSELEFVRTRALFNYPIQLDGKGSYLLLGLDYSNINLILGDEERPFDKEQIDGFQIFDFNIGYTTKINEDWRFGARIVPGFSSNLSAKKIGFDDAVLSGDLVFIKDKKADETIEKPFRLIVGLSYGGNRGFPYPLPFISYYRKIHPKWSYNLGVPRTNLQYHLSERQRLKANLQLDGFTANIQDGLPLLSGQNAESINMSLVLAGLQYEFHFSEHLEFFLRSSYIISRNLQLRDGDKDNILLLDDSHGLSLRTGLRFKI
ncbi:DUF6268 family outer membrane beta-barrel protein [Maribacter sp. 2-571]|uniref:DUF6268 family outer membrane beta-barrel protein n=1 Tax=Maribacter sp. 2-571 TaxID=3417569 RepID=UPI003D337B7F